MPGIPGRSRIRVLFGFDIAVINGAIVFLRQQFSLSDLQTEFAASSLLAGCVAGASIAGMLSDRFGRRRILIVSALLFAGSSLGAALPRTLAEFAAALSGPHAPPNQIFRSIILSWS